MAKAKVDRCVQCGQIVPEGMIVCGSCNSSSMIAMIQDREYEADLLDLTRGMAVKPIEADECKIVIDDWGK